MKKQPRVRPFVAVFVDRGRGEELVMASNDPDAVYATASRIAADGDPVAANILAEVRRQIEEIGVGVEVHTAAGECDTENEARTMNEMILKAAPAAYLRSWGAAG